MQTVEAFLAAQYPCPDCGHINVMTCNLEHPELGYAGNCCQCKRRWQFKEMVSALIRSTYGDAITIEAFELFTQSDTVNNHAIIFDCDSCGQTTTILPTSIIKSMDEGKIIEESTYEGKVLNELPDVGICEHCRTEFKLDYPLAETKRN